MRWIIDLAAIAVVACMTSLAIGFVPDPPFAGGETQWGTLAVAGNTVTVTGGQHWVATGTIQGDGEVHLHWFQVADERHAFGIYRPKEGSLVGHWCWGEDVRLENGKVIGPDKPETIAIRPKVAPKAEGPDL